MKKSFTHRLLVTLAITGMFFQSLYPLIPMYRVYAEDIPETEVTQSSSSSSEESMETSSTSISSSSSSSMVSLEDFTPNPKKGGGLFSVQKNDSSSSSPSSSSSSNPSISNLSSVNGQCVADYSSHLTCTANDVSVGSVSNIQILDDGCTSPTDTVTFSANWNVQSTASQRYNVGLWIATGGQTSALNGSCTTATLPVTPVPPYINLDNNACGDITSSSSISTPVTLTVKCSDPDGNNKLNIPYVTSWDQNGGNCSTPIETLPGAPSKCKSDTGFEVNIPVPYFAKVEVKKVISPSTNSGTFNLSVDGVNKVSNVGNNGSTGIINVTAGTSDVPGASHSVGESAYTGTNINDYVSTYNCLKRGTSTVVSSGSGVGPVNINFVKDDDIVCTFTNTLKTGTITVQKLFDGSYIGNYTDACFTLNPDPGNGQVCATNPNGTATFINVPYGTYSVTESSVNPGFSVKNSTCSSLVLNSNFPTGNCSVTNKRDTGKITIDKTVIPYNDSTSFTFTRTGNDQGTSVWEMTGNNAPVSQTLPTGIYTFEESQVTNWVNTSIVCSNGWTSLTNVKISKDADITCTFTNVLTPVITIALDTTHEVGDDHTFIVTVGFNGSEGFVPVADGTIVTSNVTPSGSVIDDSDCTNGTTSGTCSIIVNSTTPGTFTVNALSNVVVDGHTFNLSTSVSPASVTFVDGRIVISPLNATNNVNEAHTFTVYVYQNPGSGEIVSTNALVTFSLLNNTAGASFVNGNTCTTNASGVCSVQINTSTPGNVEVNALANLTPGGVSIVRTTDGTHGSSVNGSKSYVAGRIIIVKQTLPDGDTTKFEFTTSYGENFELADGESNDSGFLPVGTYSVSELTKSGWINTGFSCDNDNISSSEISITAGDVVNCTFTNTKNGHLIVQKTTLPTLDQTVFDISINGSGNVTGGSAGNISDTNDYDYEVTPGTYSVSEDSYKGWVNTSNGCQNIVVGAGETKYCEIVNTKLAILVVQKTTNPSLDPTLFDINLSSNDQERFEPNLDLGDKVSDSTDVTYTFLYPGTYTVTETVPEGWIQDSTTCNNVVLNPGETKTCVLTNSKLSNVKIVKNATVNALDNFVFNSTLGSFTLDDDEGVVGADDTYMNSKLFKYVVPGEYTFSEVNPTTLWGLRDVVCIEGENTPYTVYTTTLTGIVLTVPAGKNITCTFNNVLGSVLGEQTGQVLAVTGDNTVYAQLFGLMIILSSFGLLILSKTRRKYSK